MQLVGSSLHFQGAAALPLKKLSIIQKRRSRCCVRAALDPDTAASLVNVGQFALPALGGALISVVGAKLAAYSQMEVVQTAMLGRHVKSGGARVLQFGGSTRDLFYYPPGTLQVTVAAEDLIVGLWEQAGFQSGVPVREVKESMATTLSGAAGAVYDSVVAFDELGNAADVLKLTKEVWRVLKPGGTFIFIQKLDNRSPVAALVRLGGNSSLSSSPAGADVGDVIAGARAWDFSQWDIACGVLDPHAVGVTIKPLQGGAAVGVDGEFSVEKEAFEQVLKSSRQGKKAAAKEQQQKGFGG